MKKHGFTLIELSIVLIIIGLIIGGILAGEELVKQAKNRAIINEINGYVSSIGIFKLKYDALPGDIPNAKTFWSGTGNGNGDGRIDYSETVVGDGGEFYRASEHLSLSGVVQDRITYPNTLILKATKTLSYFTYDGPFYKIPMSNWIQNALKLSSVNMYNIDLKMDDGKASTGKFIAIMPTISSTGYCVTNPWNTPTADYIIPDPNNYEGCRLWYLLPF